AFDPNEIFRISFRIADWLCSGFAGFHHALRYPRIRYEREAVESPAVGYLAIETKTDRVRSLFQRNPSELHPCDEAVIDLPVARDVLLLPRIFEVRRSPCAVVHFPFHIRSDRIHPRPENIASLLDDIDSVLRLARYVAIMRKPVSSAQQVALHRIVPPVLL